MTDSRTYTTFGEPQTYAVQVNGTPVLEVTYGRDALGRITEKTETVEGVTTVTGYRYDAGGRLDQVTTDGVVTAEYVYDANGNRLSATTPGGTVTGTYDAQDRVLAYGDATCSVPLWSRHQRRRNSGAMSAGSPRGQAAAAMEATRPSVSARRSAGVCQARA